MHGPEQPGFWTRGMTPSDYPPLRVGRRYRLIQPFTDFDGAFHELGEEWTFLGYNYLPHDSGLSLFVSLDGASEWHIRMQCYPEAQGPIVDHLFNYLEEI